MTSAHVSHFRYNRYGYPVFPQKPFGLPSPTGKKQQKIICYFNEPSCSVFAKPVSPSFRFSLISIISRSGLLCRFLLALVPADDLQPGPGLDGADWASPPRQRTAPRHQAEDEEEEEVVQYILRSLIELIIEQSKSIIETKF